MTDTQINMAYTADSVPRFVVTMVVEREVGQLRIVAGGRAAWGWVRWVLSGRRRG